MKSIKVTPLEWEMLMLLSKKHKPPIKPEAMIKELIETAYSKSK